MRSSGAYPLSHHSLTRPPVCQWANDFARLRGGADKRLLCRLEA
jgi:hypothetical protein